MDATQTYESLVTEQIDHQASAINISNELDVNKMGSRTSTPHQTPKKPPSYDEATRQDNYLSPYQDFQVVDIELRNRNQHSDALFTHEQSVQLLKLKNLQNTISIIIIIAWTSEFLSFLIFLRVFDFDDKILLTHSSLQTLFQVNLFLNILLINPLILKLQKNFKITWLKVILAILIPYKIMIFITTIMVYETLYASIPQ